VVAALKSSDGLNNSFKIALLSRPKVLGCIEKGSPFPYSFDERVPQAAIGGLIAIRAPPPLPEI
jgi:hypothetical protein